MEDNKMKKLVVLFSVAMFSLAGFANSPTSWVASKDGRMRVEKVNIGINNARIVLETGEKIVMPLAKLDSYSLNGRIYEKKMVYRNGKPTGDMAYMELINSRGGLSLFKNVENDPESTEPLKTYDRFYVYNGDALHLTVNDKSLPSVFNFYGIKWSYR